MDSRERFSNRADDYVKFRPSYPPGVVATLRELGAGPRVADIGSGTGISSSLLLGAGFEVFGVEPNAAMRAKAEAELREFRAFHSVNGTSENTTLPPSSVDLVIAAQAFHWFEPNATRAEFRRILREGGQVAILFNDRDASTPLGRAYEATLLEFGNDYANVRHRNVGEERHRAFLGDFQEWLFPNSQILDFSAFLGRVTSSSYAPKEGETNFGPMRTRLKELFESHQRDGVVKLAYVTQLLVARW